jgi:hypothetical protein
LIDSDKKRGGIKMTKAKAEMNDVSMNEVREAIVALNDSGLIPEKVKVVGTKKEVIEEFRTVVDKLPDDIKLPKLVKALYNKIIDEKIECELPAGPPENKKKPAGVIVTILDIIKKNGPIDKAGILAKLTKTFPEREANKMASTIKAQVGGKQRPCRMEQERAVTFMIDERGRYSIE